MRAWRKSRPLAAGLDYTIRIFGLADNAGGKMTKLRNVGMQLGYAVRLGVCVKAVNCSFGVACMV